MMLEGELLVGFLDLVRGPPMIRPCKPQIAQAIWKRRNSTKRSKTLSLRTRPWRGPTNRTASCQRHVPVHLREKCGTVRRASLQRNKFAVHSQPYVSNTGFFSLPYFPPACAMRRWPAGLGGDPATRPATHPRQSILFAKVYIIAQRLNGGAHGLFGYSVTLSDIQGINHAPV